VEEEAVMTIYAKTCWGVAGAFLIAIIAIRAGRNDSPSTSPATSAEYPSCREQGEAQPLQARVDSRWTIFHALCTAGYKCFQYTDGRGRYYGFVSFPDGSTQEGYFGFHPDEDEPVFDDRGHVHFGGYSGIASYWDGPDQYTGARPCYEKPSKSYVNPHDGEDSHP
jgi:hypothetical protein